MTSPKFASAFLHRWQERHRAPGRDQALAEGTDGAPTIGPGTEGHIREGEGVIP